MDCVRYAVLRLTKGLRNRYDPSKSLTWTSTSTALDYKFDNPYAHPGPRTAQQADDIDSPQSPTVIDVDAVVGTERIQDPRGDPEERRIAVVQRMTDAAGSNSVARFERGSSGIWGLGIDKVSTRCTLKPKTRDSFLPVYRILQQTQSSRRSRILKERRISLWD
jgi:hypothetical protein